MKKLHFLLLMLIISLASCKQKSDYQQAEDKINEKDYREMVRVLSQDEFQGRFPGTVGEEKTIAYLADEFKKLGLKPAFNGSYFQDVPLIGFTNNMQGNALVTSGKGEFVIENNKDIAAASMAKKDLVQLLNKPLVFAGYGITAPNLKWDDYNGMDMSGKVVVVLLGNPKENSPFKTKGVTSFGRRGYKFLEGARHNAAGVLVIHLEKEIGYPFSILVDRPGSVTIQSAEILEKNKRPEFEASISQEIAQKLFAHLGFDLDKLMQQAAVAPVKPLPLNANFNVKLACTHKDFISKNVGAILEGSTLKDQCIVYTGHWDHLGIGAPINGDSIINGAVDNGTTLAWMYGIAKGFVSLKEKPKRSILFLAPTAEESGLLGTYYYCNHPVFSMENTVACFNNDLMIPMGRMKDVMITGFGFSELDQYVDTAARKHDRYICDDTHPERGMFFRSDHLAFALKGVPVMYARGNADSREHGKHWTDSVENKYVTDIYHHPADNYDAKAWDVSGLLEDTKLFFEIGYRLSNLSAFPKWKEGVEYKAIRDKQGK